MIDFLGFEPHFLDHGAPVWSALPTRLRGRYIVDESLFAHAQSHGIDATTIRADHYRGDTPPKANPGPGPIAFAVSIGDIKVGRRLGYRRFIFLEHGAGQTYSSTAPTMASYAGGPDREDCGLFLTPNEYSAGHWRRAYPQADVAVVGCPRLDALPALETGPGTVAIAFHGRWPTGVEYGGNALGDFLPQLPVLAERFPVIGHAHPGMGRQWQRTMARLYEKAGIEFVEDFDEVCRRASVYVADNSSTIFEFASTGRPVVLMNAASWIRGRGPGLRFWDAADIGINVWPGEDLAAAIEQSLRRDSAIWQRFREELLLRYVYQPSLTGAAERAAAVVEGWLARQGQVAA